MIIRSYKGSDYEEVVALYKDTTLYGGQFDPDRDSKSKLNDCIHKDPNSILVCVSNRKIKGTVSIVENPRTAFLFRFAVSDNNIDVAKSLYEKACNILQERNHNVVLVYSECDNDILDSRYAKLGMTKGGRYSCFWEDIQ